MLVLALSKPARDIARLRASDRHKESFLFQNKPLAQVVNSLDVGPAASDLRSRWMPPIQLGLL
jgi:hypothetical protein